MWLLDLNSFHFLFIHAPISGSVSASFEVPFDTHAFKLLSGGFQFCDDDGDDDDGDNMDAFFRSVFGVNRSFYWSFVDGENFQWSSSSRYSGRSWNWRHRFEEEYESESESLQSDLASDRMALGLSAYGPLKLEDVKHA